MTYQFQNRYRQQAKSKGSGQKFAKLREEGTTVLRLFTFKHTVTEGDFKLGRYLPTDDVKVGQEVEELSFFERIHWVDRQPNICGLIQTTDGRWMGKCEHCDIVQEFRDAGEDEKARKLAANKKYLVNAADVTDDKDEYEIKTYKLSKTVYDRLMTDLESRRYANKVLFGAEGRDLEINFDKTKPPAMMYTSAFLDPEDCVDLTGKVTGEPRDFYSVAEFVPADFRHHITVSPSDTAEEEKPAPKKRGRKKAAAKKEEPEDAYPAGSEWAINIPDDEGNEVASVCTVVGRTADGQLKIECDGEQYVCDESDLSAKEE